MSVMSKITNEFVSRVESEYFPGRTLCAGCVLGGYGAVVSGAYLAARKVGPVAVGAVIGGAIGCVAGSVFAVAQPQFVRFEDSVLLSATAGATVGAMTGAVVTKVSLLASTALHQGTSFIGRAFARASRESEGIYTE